MPLDSPAKFARALTFGTVAPIPTWTKSGDAEVVFPHALGWNNIFQVTQIDFPPDAVYGVPFLSLGSTIEPFLSLESLIDSFIDKDGR